jgi:hypothetical protein
MKRLFFTILAALSCMAVFGQQAKLVITPFEDREAKLAAAPLNNPHNFLIDAIDNTGRFQAPDRNAITPLAQEQEFQLSDWADDTKSAQLGKALNAHYAVRVIAMHKLKSFYMGKYEVTQKERQEVMGNNPSHFKGDNLPVDSVN